MTHSAFEDAQYFFQLAFQCHKAKKFDEAIELFQKSIDAHASAEGYCFLGWSLSAQGKYDEAIEKCKRAILLDPEFGNPYNDIGAYLIHLGRLDEAVPWLELACSSRRYNARHYPHFNLGRIYERRGSYAEAIKEYEEAARLDPNYKRARQAVEKLRGWMN
jgi:tetratricopeptide (TPR) repeat protein